MSETVIIGGLGPNVNIAKAELLLGWSDALDSKPIGLEEYVRNRLKEEPRADQVGGRPAALGSQTPPNQGRPLAEEGREEAT